MILSYHPILEGDIWRLCAGRDPDEEDFELMSRAGAILLPQGRHFKLYSAASKYCTHVFPDYYCRYAYPGKIGDIQLFKELDLPHPKTFTFTSVCSCPEKFWQTIPYPAVLKNNYGGEGRLVSLAYNQKEARETLEMYAKMEQSGFSGFLVQEFIPAQSRTLRVVVMGERYYAYWRVQPDTDNFLHNIQAGAIIDHDSDPELQAMGIDVVKKLACKSGINLAGVDLLFPETDVTGKAEALLLEINYYFARKGLGGSDRYYELLQEAVEEWLQNRGLQQAASKY
jgi:ribosomal protein S6--L-glutamate ligase